MRQPAGHSRRTRRGRIAGFIAAALIMTVSGACSGGGSSEDAAADNGRRVESGGSAADAGAGGAGVTIKLFMFDPSPLRIEAGTKVTWTNEDQILHTVTAGTRTYDAEGLAREISPSGEFDLPLDGQGSTAEFTFNEPGTVKYLCKIHPGMDTEVVVT